MIMSIEIAAVFLPLMAFMVAFLFGKVIGDKGAQLITCVSVITAAILSCALFLDVVRDGNVRVTDVATWISSGSFQADWSLRVDQLSVVMMCVVTIVSACVHVYSVGYMSHDKSQARFMSYLSLFTFAMLMLVTSDNLLQLFFGWEGVGVASYLLIGFWNHKHSANKAAVKAFIVNRVGDFGLALGLMACFVLFGSIEFSVIFENVAAMQGQYLEFLGYHIHALTLIALLLFMGAIGKSAQLGLHTWLPDAMEGPTPVSALIHAATMVTAGVFLIARFSPLYEFAPFALMIVCVFGALTAIFAATIGMTQFDIKRVIAYSTMSQLGYMFFALGVSAYGAAMFHLMTHAFFKALLFLGAGSVIHAMSDEQDMRNMGGIYKKIPATYVFMWIGSLALAGMPFFAGFYSKDMILEAAYADHSSFGMFAFWMGIAAALLTAFYSWRVLILTFHGAPRADEKVMGHVHESPLVMIIPLSVLAIGALFAGFFFYPGFVGDLREAFWGESLFILPQNDTVEAAHHVPLWVKKLPIIMGSLGILLAYIAYLWTVGFPEKMVKIFKPVHTLFLNKWYVDELYNAAFVRPVHAVGEVLFKRGDGAVINKAGIGGTTCVSRGIAALFSRLQTGFVYHYAFVMIVGLIGFMSWVVYRFY
jgi:NADH-quinone oxidoreductase subunit L